MKFKWYHIFLMIITAICVAVLAYGILNFIDRKGKLSEDSSSKTVETSSIKKSKDIDENNEEVLINENN